MRPNIEASPGMALAGEWTGTMDRQDAKPAGRQALEAGTTAHA